MKIALKRFCHQATLCSQTDEELDNGNDIPVNKPLFDFTYANLNQSISDKLSNLGNASTSKKVIATLDPRVQGVVNSDGYHVVKIGESTFKIDGISKDESEILMPFYELTIEIDDSNGD